MHRPIERCWIKPAEFAARQKQIAARCIFFFCGQAILLGKAPRLSLIEKSVSSCHETSFAKDLTNRLEILNAS
jgi:hypothetical protein